MAYKDTLFGSNHTKVNTDTPMHKETIDIHTTDARINQCFVQTRSFVLIFMLFS